MCDRLRDEAHLGEPHGSVKCEGLGVFGAEVKVSVVSRITSFHRSVICAASACVAPEITR